MQGVDGAAFCAYPVLHIVDDVDDVQGVDGVARVAFNFDWMPEGVLIVHSYVHMRPSHMIIVYDYPFTGTIEGKGTPASVVVL